MSRPRLLDLFCCAGVGGQGYADAGFEVIGVDEKPQPRYPFEFVQADALSILRGMVHYPTFSGEMWRPGYFAAIHTSPPCKVHTSLRPLSGAHHVDLIPQTRELLIATGLPYVIENVVGAPLLDPITLCGSSFGLAVRRHRLFESNVALTAPACEHERQDAESPGYPYRRSGGRHAVSKIVTVHGTGSHGVNIAGRRAAMGVTRAVTGAELAEGIPPAYTRHLGAQLLASLAVPA